jgi:hypothetical protein
VPAKGSTSVTPEKRKKFIAAIAAGNFRETAAAHAGVTYKSVQRFLAQKTEESEAFRLLIEDAESAIEMELVELQFKAARAGDSQTSRWILTIKKPHLYGQRREEGREIQRLIRKLEEQRAELHEAIAKVRGKKARGRPLAVRDR